MWPVFDLVSQVRNRMPDKYKSFQLSGAAVASSYVTLLEITGEGFLDSAFVMDINALIKVTIDGVLYISVPSNDGSTLKGLVSTSQMVMSPTSDFVGFIYLRDNALKFQGGGQTVLNNGVPIPNNQTVLTDKPIPFKTSLKIEHIGPTAFRYFVRGTVKI